MLERCLRCDFKNYINFERIQKNNNNNNNNISFSITSVEESYLVSVVVTSHE